MRATPGAALCAALLAIALAGCAAPAFAPASDRPSTALAPVDGGHLIDLWQRQLEAYVAGPGFGDPGVLSQLPLLRTAAVARPGQTVFAAIDLESSMPERDGYDVCGLLLGTLTSAGELHHVFVVGIVRRSDYRPVAVADIRLVAMRARQGTLVWDTGAADPLALARYRSHWTQGAPRFPGAEDRFSMTACDAGACAVERASGARWALSF